LGKRNLISKATGNLLITIKNKFLANYIAFIFLCNSNFWQNV